MKFSPTDGLVKYLSKRKKNLAVNIDQLFIFKQTGYIFGYILSLLQILELLSSFSLSKYGNNMGCKYLKGQFLPYLYFLVIPQWVKADGQPAALRSAPVGGLLHVSF